MTGRPNVTAYFLFPSSLSLSLSLSYPSLPLSLRRTIVYSNLFNHNPRTLFDGSALTHSLLFSRHLFLVLSPSFACTLTQIWSLSHSLSLPSSLSTKLFCLSFSLSLFLSFCHSTSHPRFLSPFLTLQLCLSLSLLNTLFAVVHHKLSLLLTLTHPNSLSLFHSFLHKQTLSLPLSIE